jgi:hypothetical protein
MALKKMLKSYDTAGGRKFRCRAYANAFDELNGPVFWDS